MKRKRRYQTESWKRGGTRGGAGAGYVHDPNPSAPKKGGLGKAAAQLAAADDIINQAERLVKNHWNSSDDEGELEYEIDTDDYHAAGGGYSDYYSDVDDSEEDMLDLYEATREDDIEADGAQRVFEQAQEEYSTKWAAATKLSSLGDYATDFGLNDTRTRMLRIFNHVNTHPAFSETSLAHKALVKIQMGVNDRKIRRIWRQGPSHGGMDDIQAGIYLERNIERAKIRSNDSPLSVAADNALNKEDAADRKAAHLSLLEGAARARADARNEVPQELPRGLQTDSDDDSWGAFDNVELPDKASAQQQLDEIGKKIQEAADSDDFVALQDLIKQGKHLKEQIEDEMKSTAKFGAAFDDVELEFSSSDDDKEKQ